METQEKFTQVLDRQIANIQEKIIKTKVNIADLFIKTISTDIKTIQDPKDMLPFIEEVEKIPVFIDEIKHQESILELLNKSRNEIISSYSIA